MTGSWRPIVSNHEPKNVRLPPHLEWTDQKMYCLPPFSPGCFSRHLEGCRLPHEGEAVLFPDPVHRNLTKFKQDLLPLAQAVARHREDGFCSAIGLIDRFDAGHDWD